MKIKAIAALFTLLVVVAPQTSFAEGDSEGEEAPARNPVAIITTSMGEIHVELFREAAPKTVANFLDLAEGRKELADPVTGEPVKKPFYDGLVFHRIIKDFMIQGGCPNGNGSGDAGYKFEDEINGAALGLDKLKVIQNGMAHPWLLVRNQGDFQRVILQPLFNSLGIDSQAKLDARRDEVQKKLEALTLLDAYKNLGYSFSDTLPSVKMAKGRLAMANAGPNTNGSQFFINLGASEWLNGKHTVFGEVIKGMDVVEAIGAVAANPASGTPVEPVTIVSIREWKGDYPWDELKSAGPDDDDADSADAEDDDSGDDDADDNDDNDDEVTAPEENG